MIDIDKDYLITVDLKNTKVKSDKTIFFYNTDLNICNIFIKLICTDEDKTIPDDLIVEFAVLKPETDEFKPLDATLISKEDLLYQVDLTTDYFDIVGKYSCEIRVSGTIENELKCFTSEEFDYVVKPNITAKLNKKIKNDKNLPILEKLIKDVKEITDGINKNEIQMKRDENLVGDNKTVVGAINQLREDVNSGIGGGTVELKDYQKKNDEFLNTDEKTITGGINEVNNKIKKVQESQIELDKDDVSFNGIDDISHDELNTTNKTLIGAINEVNTQCKDIANVLNNIQTDVEVTKDIKISISDNTFIPATAQEQEVTVEFTKGNTNAIPVFTNLFKGKTSVQINNITSQLLNEDEIEYKGTGNDSGTTAYFRAGVGNLIYNHVYYYSIWLKSSDNTINYTLGIDSNVRGTVTETYKKYSCLETNRVSVANATAYMGVKAGIFKPNATYFMKKPMCIDLTALYGEGNEPTLEEFDNLIGDNWCLGTYTPPSGTVSNDFTIKSYKSDNSLIDSLDSKTDTTIKIIGGGYVNITADILPKSAILKNVKYTEKRKLEIEEKGLNIGSYENALTLINSNKDNIFMYILIQGEIQKPIWHIGNGVFIDAVGAIISL